MATRLNSMLVVQGLLVCMLLELENKIVRQSQMGWEHYCAEFVISIF
jgi:hypothetical protein